MANRLQLKLTENLLKKNKSDNTPQQKQGVNAKHLQRAIDNPSPETLTPDVINALQASHGNHFVNGLVQNMGGAPTVGAGLSAPIQAKLTVTAANDAHEQEADNVAKNVVSQIKGGDVQRHDEEMQAKRIDRADMPDEEMPLKRIERSLPGMEEEPSNASPASGAANAAPTNAPEEEQLAAKRIERSLPGMEEEAPAGASGGAAPEEEQLAAKRLERSLPEEEMPSNASPASGASAATNEEPSNIPEEQLAAKRLQRAAGGDLDFYNGGDVSNDIESQIEGARGGGQALDDNTRGNMESAFGADFSNVRVHTDAQSSELNNSVQAKAFTTGQDIFFNKGQYDPNSGSGQELLAHELTHVVQQNGAAVQKKEDD